MLYGVDVHPRYQAGINLELLPAQGYTYAAIKATQGTYLTIAEYGRWTERVRKAGMIPGAYHWLDGRSSGASQARYFFDYVRKSAGGFEGVIQQTDNEDTAVPATWQHTKDFSEEMAQLTGGHPEAIYTGEWWWGPRGWDGASLTPYLWDSQYIAADLDTVPDDPAAFAARIPASFWTNSYGGWKAPTILQFTSKGDAGGLGNNVDLNATKLTMDQLLALTTSGGSDMPLSDKDAQALIWRVQALISNSPTVLGGPTKGEVNQQFYANEAAKAALTPEQLLALEATIQKAVEDAAAGIDVDEAAIAKAVNDDAAARLKD